MVDIRSENTMSPDCQCCQPGITFKIFKWDYIVLLFTRDPLVMVNNIRKAHTAVLETMDQTVRFSPFYRNYVIS